jgi:hypothetical protein
MVEEEEECDTGSTARRRGGDAEWVEQVNCILHHEDEEHAA